MAISTWRSDCMLLVRVEMIGRMQLSLCSGIENSHNVIVDFQENWYFSQLSTKAYSHDRGRYELQGREPKGDRFIYKFSIYKQDSIIYIFICIF